MANTNENAYFISAPGMHHSLRKLLQNEEAVKEVFTLVTDFSMLHMPESPEDELKELIGRRIAELHLREHNRVSWTVMMDRGVFEAAVGLLLAWCTEVKFLAIRNIPRNIPLAMVNMVATAAVHARSESTITLEKLEGINIHVSDEPLPHEYEGHLTTLYRAACLPAMRQITFANTRLVLLPGQNILKKHPSSNLRSIRIDDCIMSPVAMKWILTFFKDLQCVDIAARMVPSSNVEVEKYTKYDNETLDSVLRHHSLSLTCLRLNLKSEARYSLTGYISGIGSLHHMEKLRDLDVTWDLLEGVASESLLNMLPKNLEELRVAGQGGGEAMMREVESMSMSEAVTKGTLPKLRKVTVNKDLLLGYLQHSVEVVKQRFGDMGVELRVLDSII
ncbi:hypothetical protein NA57DRAFT_53148 [Rhizodiscina lignyota]|uniref:Uncharacterized protein n=1 Tax=Rhizodiscina lignyota TaxID=1504668 RepID=A0A9P4MD00_9PEZI|nr:hypothetical protein NA57DRAFT_53148 [Rhizodiscina lignyota]